MLITTFFALLPKVTKNLSLPPRQPAAEQTEPREDPVPPGNSSSQKEPPPEKPPSSQTPPAAPVTAKPTEEKPAPARDKQQDTAATQPSALQPSVEKTPEKTPPPPAQTPQQTTPPEKPTLPPEETRDRDIYFMRSTGADLQLSKVSRKIKVSDSPLLDCLSALLAGPSAEEKARGLVSFMPPNTRIISALVRGDTAYLNFNEEFQYNTLGREGCAAQIQQIVWTATEFPNVRNVQILIEGNRVDFLSEGVMIGSPLSR